jgi:hypothetical protein
MVSTDVVGEALTELNSDGMRWPASRFPPTPWTVQKKFAPAPQLLANLP